MTTAFIMERSFGQFFESLFHGFDETRQGFHSLADAAVGIGGAIVAGLAGGFRDYHLAQVMRNLLSNAAKYAGPAAIGHVRYSTTGETALRNVQPLFAELALGGFAVAHNGNISNAMHLRRELNARGSIFQSTSDTEVIIHLVATSSFRSLLDRFIDALKQVEGAYSLLCLTKEGLIACRDPLGIRPLVMGRLGDAYIFASETVALDVIGATYIRTVEPGEMIVVSEKGLRSLRPFAASLLVATETGSLSRIDVHWGGMNESR
jgi:amidophosphoribosyltransferase